MTKTLAVATTLIEVTMTIEAHAIVKATTIVEVVITIETPIEAKAFALT